MNPPDPIKASIASDSADGDAKLELRHVTLHGHQVAYRQAGEGPVVMLVHGITSNSRTWERVMPLLSRHFTVIAPDLIGHGQSAKPNTRVSLPIVGVNATVRR